MPKPPFCNETNCDGGMQLVSPEDLEKGYSCFCMGTMIDPEKDRFVFREADHLNEFYFCFYTPLKGWVKSMMDTNDLWHQLLVMNNIAKKGNWRKCDSCGDTQVQKDYFVEDGKTTCDICKKQGMQLWSIKAKIRTALDHIESDQPIQAVEYLTEILSMIGGD